MPVTIPTETTKTTLGKTTNTKPNYHQTEAPQNEVDHPPSSRTTDVPSPYILEKPPVTEDIQRANESPIAHNHPPFYSLLFPNLAKKLSAKPFKIKNLEYGWWKHGRHGTKFPNKGWLSKK